MTTQATWKVTIIRRNGAEYRYDKQTGRAPVLGEMIDPYHGGQHPIRARINSFHYDPPKRTSVGVYEINAIEIKREGDRD